MERQSSWRTESARSEFKASLIYKEFQDSQGQVHVYTQSNPTLKKLKMEK